MDVKRLFDERKFGNEWNTSYPVRPLDWNRYRTSSSLSFKEEQELALYIHIPFCKQLCSFCEYTKCLCPDNKHQTLYVNTLLKDIDKFLSLSKSFLIKGFDIGGGTPTSLNEDCFELLMNAYSNVVGRSVLANDFEPSIESTFQTISKSKLELIAKSGIQRISFGVQSSLPSVTSLAKRFSAQLPQMEHVIDCARLAGIKKINLDFMYGLKSQTMQSLSNDLQLIEILRPEQVTLYELRTNMINESSHTNVFQRYEMYCRFYDALHEFGYFAPFGQNTFSMNNNDMGLSSYLRNRMVNCLPYKGFGISAQSMNTKGLSYNIGKNQSNLIDFIKQQSYNEEYTYILPPSEVASKYLAIAAYSGAFSLTTLSHILHFDAKDYYREQIDFCLENNLLSLDKDTLRVTREGFKYYGAVFSLFVCPSIL